MRSDKKNLIVDVSFEFSLKIIEFAEELESKRKFVFANQLLKAGTSRGANIREAQNAESKADFIHKMNIAAKEADEVEYFLLLCKCAKSYPFDQELLDRLNDIIRILSKIISSSKKQFSN